MSDLEAMLARERAARIEAERKNQLKDRFLAAVSHELRAPLMTLLLWEQVLRDESESADIRKQALDAIHASAVAQSRLVGDLLDVSRAVSGKLRVDLRPLDPELLLLEVLAECRPLAERKNITITHQRNIKPVNILGDIGRLRQIFENLINNALKFTDPGGRVEIVSKTLGRSLQIIVTDTGRGISPSMLPRLFEPFSQADDLLDGSQGGLGLGLMIAHELVALHRGTLEADSAGLGKGATLTIQLPIMRRRRAGTSTPPVGTKVVLANVRILVLDDDRRVREALTLLLERCGAIVVSADGPDSARAQLARSEQDALICDIAMPVEDGYTFIKKLRASGNRTPAIALTAHATTADAQRAHDAGFDIHVAKPVNFEKLVQMIHQTIATSAQTRT